MISLYFRFRFSFIVRLINFFMCFNEPVHRCDIGLKIDAIDEVIKRSFFYLFCYLFLCRFLFDKFLVISCMPITEIRFHGNSVKPLMFSY